MNALFVLSFLFLLRYEKLSIFCLISIFCFYLPIDDFSVNCCTSALMSYCAIKSNKITLKSLFFLCAGINVLSLLSNYYFDYFGYEIEQLHNAAYIVYLLFTPVAITINVLIILDILRMNRDRITTDIAMLSSFLRRRHGTVFDRQNANSTKKG